MKQISFLTHFPIFGVYIVIMKLKIKQIMKKYKTITHDSRKSHILLLSFLHFWTVWMKCSESCQKCVIFPTEWRMNFLDVELGARTIVKLIFCILVTPSYLEVILLLHLWINSLNNPFICTILLYTLLSSIQFHFPVSLTFHLWDGWWSRGVI